MIIINNFSWFGVMRLEMPIINNHKRMEMHTVSDFFFSKRDNFLGFLIKPDTHMIPLTANFHNLAW